MSTPFDFSSANQPSRRFSSGELMAGGEQASSNKESGSHVQSGLQLWVSPRTFLFSIQVATILLMIACFQWLVFSQQVSFPSWQSALLIGLVFGMIVGTQAWDVGTRWTTMLRLVSGVGLVQISYPVFARLLGGPADQWWTSLVLMLLVAQATQSMFQPHRIVGDFDQLDRRHSAKPLDFGLIDLMTFAALLAVVFQLGKFTYQSPIVTLKSFAWFGSFAVLVVVSRFVICQLGRQCRSVGLDTVNWRMGNRVSDESVLPDGGRNVGSDQVLKSASWLNAGLESVGLLLLLAALDWGAYYLVCQRSSPGFVLFVLLLTAQVWQLLDAWLQFLIGQQSVALRR